MKFPLAKPIQAHGDEVAELTLREPNGEDVEACKGLPYYIGDNEAIVINAAVAMKYVSRCAEIPMGSVRQIALGDLNNLFWWITGFFLNQGAKRPS